MSRAYGEWIRDEAEKKIRPPLPESYLLDGTLLPSSPGSGHAPSPCPNPACGIEMPLVRSWWLGKKKGKEAYVRATNRARPDAARSGRRVRCLRLAIILSRGAEAPIVTAQLPTDCSNMPGMQGLSVPLRYVRAEGARRPTGRCADGRCVAEGNRRREIPPLLSEEHWQAARS